MSDKILASLVKVFKSFDEKNLEQSYIWAENTRLKLIEFKKSDEYKFKPASSREEAYRNEHARYEKMFAMCGGKTWYNVINNSTIDDLRRFVLKNHNATIEKRNNKIAAKLIKANIQEVVYEKYTQSNDGFNGHFVVETDNGVKHIKIESIIAGGYNIQCAHMRVLVHIK